MDSRRVQALSEAPRCYYCTRPLTRDVLSWDHVVPLCRGGDNGADNKVRACKRCNNRKGPLTAEEFLAVRDDNRARKQAITEVLRQIGKIPPRGDPVDGVHGVQSL